MMGRVVEDMYLPLFKYAPSKPPTMTGQQRELERPHNPNDIIPDILPEPSLTTNRRDFVSTVTDKSLKASLSKIFGLGGSLNESQKVSLESKEVRRYTLSNPGEYFKALMEDELYERDIQALLKGTSRGVAYLVVGFLTTSNAQWGQEKNHETSVSTDVKIPITAAVAQGVPIPVDLDPAFTASVSKGQSSNVTYKSPDEEIFAIAYIPVKSSKFLFRTKKVVVGWAKSAGAGHLAFGAGDSDSSAEDTDDPDADKPADEDIQGHDILLDEGQGEGQLNSFEF
jgi:hypothetical protein